MRTRMRTLTLPLVLAIGCVPHVPPRRDEPHALVKVRVSYHHASGPGLQHVLYLNGRQTDVPLPPGSVKTPYTTVLRVAPGESAWRFVSAFHHEERRARPISPAAQPGCAVQPTAAGAHNAMHGPTSTPCRSFSGSAPAQALDELVVDARCEARTEHVARANALYLLQYDFHGDGQCTLRCYLQVPRSDGELSLEPCSR